MKGGPSYLPLDEPTVDARHHPRRTRARLCSPFYLVLVAACLFILAVSSFTDRGERHGDKTMASQEPTGKRSFSFESVGGFFKQDDEKTDVDRFDVFAPEESFGRIAPTWKDFHKAVSDLQKSSGEGEIVKVIFAGRHGQGFHNVAESQYGTEAWDCHWAMLYDDGKLFWGPDADLTPLGKTQAKVAATAWTRELADGAPFPDLFLSSPMTRAADTLRITWMDQGKEVRPVIRELWRETIGLHTCDKRRTASYLRKTFPNYQIEAGFTEEDELWTKDHQETKPQEEVRLRKALDQLFSTDPHTYISVTAHSGIIAALLRVIGHRVFPLQTGGMIPVVVRARPGGTSHIPDAGPSATAPACAPTSA